MPGRSFLAILTSILVASVCLTACADDDNTSGSTRSPSPSVLGDAAADLSADERESIAAALEEIASQTGVVNPPEVAIVRVVSQSEWPQVYAECMTTAGFTTTVTGDGTGAQTDVPAGQHEASNLAGYICHAQYPIDPSQDDANLDDTQKMAIYEYLTQTLVDCLADQGYHVSDIPSEEVFLNGFDESPPWNPYDQVFAGNISAADGEALQAACPPNTPPEIIYGE